MMQFSDHAVAFEICCEDAKYELLCNGRTRLMVIHVCQLGKIGDLDLIHFDRIRKTENRPESMTTK